MKPRGEKRRVPNAVPSAEEVALLARLSEFVSARTGLMLEHAQWLDLRRALELVAVATNRDWRACAQWLLTPDGAEQLPLLIDQLTIGETYFYRDDALFAALREYVLPELIAPRSMAGRFLKLWCAGCSSGEEPYSLAIELARMLPDFREWSISLLATDINRRFLRKAERGIFGAWSLRHKPLTMLQPFVKPIDKDRFEVIPELRRLVSFAHLNLATDAYPSPANRTSDVDIILCRHVLMYLRPDVARDVIARLSRSLADGGWLITSSIESGLVDCAELTAVHLHDTVLFRKRGGATAGQISANPAFKNNSESQNNFASASNSVPANSLTAGAAATANRTTKNISAAIPPKSPSFAQPQTNIVRHTALSMHAANDTENLISAELDVARKLADQGRLNDASAACARAIALDKLNSEAHFLQATILLELGETAAAEHALQRTLYLDSDHISAHVALAMLALRAERRYDAGRHFRNARELLRTLPRDAAVPGSDGLTAQQLSAMIDTLAATN
jgi:chemotaxis protein methyltransferase CheR